MLKCFSQPPFFWSKQYSPLSFLLSPLSLFYYLGFTLNHAFTKPYCASIPIICLGNAYIGGSGKTPLSIALYHLVKREFPKLNIVFLTKGYKAQLKGPLFVDIGKHHAQEVGDEACLLAKTAPTCMAYHREIGVRFLEAQQPRIDLIIMDDGMQNPKIHKDLIFLILKNEYHTKNRFLLPAGPFREPLSRALHRAHIIIKHTNHIKTIPPDISGFDLNKSYIAFSGIAHPRYFFDDLQKMGFQLKDCFSFPDHYTYNHRDIIKLHNYAQNEGAELITTEKDYVRLTPYDQKNIYYLPYQLAYVDENKILAHIRPLIKTHQKK